MLHWFNGMTNVTYLDVKNIDTSNITDMSNMFYRTGMNAPVFEVIGLSGWDTSKVINMSEMFRQFAQYAELDLDFSNWNTSSVENMNHRKTSFVKFGLEELPQTALRIEFFDAGRFVFHVFLYIVWEKLCRFFLHQTVFSDRFAVIPQKIPKCNMAAQFLRILWAYIQMVRL
mgnify:CR=1 FL=1